MLKLISDEELLETLQKMAMQTQILAELQAKLRELTAPITLSTTATQRD
jgi:hypothetical protein